MLLRQQPVSHQAVQAQIPAPDSDPKLLSVKGLHRVRVSCDPKVNYGLPHLEILCQLGTQVVEDHARKPRPQNHDRLMPLTQLSHKEKVDHSAARTGSTAPYVLPYTLHKMRLNRVMERWSGRGIRPPP